METYEVEEKGLYTIAMQPLDESVYDATSGALEVFPLEDPTSVDVLRLPGDRADWLKRHPARSRVEGCKFLFNSNPLMYRVSLGDNAVPVLCLLDELKFRGVEVVDRLVRHTPTSPFEADGRNSISKRAYFQCLLCLDELFSHGIECIPSGRTNAFYTDIRKSKTIPPQRAANE